MMPLRIMTRDFQLLDEVDRYSSLQITRKWHGIGEIDLVINRYLKGADKLQRGCIVFPHNHLDKGFIIRHKQIELDENGKATENWSIKALSLKSWIGQRLAYPKNYEGDAESVMHQLILNNVVDPDDSKRKMPDIVLADNLQRGKNIKLSTHYENLSEVIEDLSLQSGLGWNIEIDKDNERFIFSVLEGRDLTVNQSDLPPAIFSTEFGTLGSMSYMESELDYKSVAIVEGPDKPNQDDVPNEEKEKYMATVGDSEGFERYEMLVGASVDTEADSAPRPPQDIINDMVEVAQDELNENAQEIYVEGQALMGRVTERVPNNVEGTAGDARLGQMDLYEDRNLAISGSAHLKNEARLRYVLADDVYSLGNKKVTLSFLFKHNKNEPVRNVEAYIYDRSKGIYGSEIQYIRHPKGNDWESYEITFDVNEDINTLDNMEITLRLRMDTTGFTSNIESKYVKVEAGDKSTPWQPAPEDGVSWYHKEKLVDLSPIDVSKLGKYQSSRFTYNVDMPIGTSATVECSLDSHKWHKLRSGDALPFDQGDWLKGRQVKLRQRLSTTEQSSTPLISSFNYVVNGYHEREKVSTARIEYQKDYDLGDMSTLQNKDWGITMDARITEVKEIYEPGNIKIDLTFDNSFPTLVDKIKREIKKRQ